MKHRLHRTSSLFLVGPVAAPPGAALPGDPATDLRPLLEIVADALQQAHEPPTAAQLAILPTMTNIALGDPYLASELVELHRRFELRPEPARGILARLRTRLAWWLLGPELQQANQVHASLVRVLDSLTVQLDAERTGRRRIEEHLADMDTFLAARPPLAAGGRAPRPLEEAAAPPADLALVWHSSFAAPTGYSGSSREFVLGLDARGVAVRPLYLYGTDRAEQLWMGQMHPRIRQLQQAPLRLDVPQVVYAPGDRFSKNSGGYRIGFTMLEVDRLPAAWVEQANQMDEIWTPTDWGRDMFLASGVQPPISVIPMGIDTTIMRPGPARTCLTDRTIFLSLFEWGPRKGWDILLRAYRAAFRPTDPVLLLLKVDCREPAVNPVAELARLLPASAPPVGLIYNQTLTTARLAELYQGIDCFVLPTRGEGWGMPIVEAMACAVPSIATDWSGQTAFLRAEDGYPLPIRGLAETSQAGPYYQGARWAEPDEAALIELLRHVAANPAERRHKGAIAAQAAQQWSWERAVDRIYRRVAAIG